MQPQTLDLATLESAALWYVNLRSESADEHLLAAHHQWLHSDPRHQQAWQRVLRVQGAFDDVSRPVIASRTIRGAYGKRRDVLKLLALLLAAGGAGTLGWHSQLRERRFADQRTAVGEMRTVRLEDGGLLQLNTDTSVNIRYGARVREIELLSGEILIETAPDSIQRPFIVHTREGSLRALGTRFTVLRETDLTRLVVLSHAVEVRPVLQSQALVTVSTGQQISLSAQAPGALLAADAQADAWTRGMLIVSDWRLDRFLTELQRYRPGVLGCDPAVRHLRISGAFSVSDTDGVLENLSRTLPIRVRSLSRYWVRLEAA